MEIFYGALGGAVWAVVGVTNEMSKPSHEPMSIAKFFRSIVIGAAIGVTSPFTGIPINQIDAMVGTTVALSATAVVDRIVSIAWKQITKKIKPKGEKK